MKHKKDNKCGEFRIPKFMMKVLADHKMIEDRVHAEYKPVLEAALNVAKIAKANIVQLVQKESNLRSCENALKESNETAKRLEMERDAWREVAKVNFSKSERLGHYKWMFWCVVLINVLEPIISMVVMFVHNHFKGV